MELDPRNLRANHPTTVRLPEPIQLSPLLRGARWLALGLGVVWGAYRLRQISYYHAEMRDMEFEKKLHEAEQKAVEKKIHAKEEALYLFKTVGLSKEEGIAQLGMEKDFAGD